MLFQTSFIINAFIDEVIVENLMGYTPYAAFDFIIIKYEQPAL